MGRGLALVALAGLLILGGAWTAHRVQTVGGVEVTDVRLPAGEGVEVSGLLYVPPTARPDHRAPAVLLSHGYINTREMQSPFAIELARRGFVVLAMDMTGHGYSTGKVGSQAFGGPAALKFLRALPQVDPTNIGLEGHSMGGGPVLFAAKAFPDGYRAMVLEGSAPGLLGQLPGGDPSFPRNLAVVFGRYDEFASLMWQVPRGADLPYSRRLRTLFGATYPVAPGKIYGDPDSGSARVLYTPPVTHPWEHFSHAGVAHAVDWLQRNLDGEARPLDPDDQIWFWKEAGTGAAFLGAVLLILGVFDLALRTPLFAPMAVPAAPPRTRRDPTWAVSLAATALIPAASFFLFMALGQLFAPQKLFPQSVTNQLLVWAGLNALLALILGRALRPPAARFSLHGARSLGIAVLSVGAAYLALLAVDAAFKVDFRFWVLGLKPLDQLHGQYFAAYLVPWVLYFLVACRAATAQLSIQGEGQGAAMLTQVLAWSGGFMLLLGVQYGFLFTTGLLAVPTEPLSTIIAIQFVPLLAVVGVITAFTYRRTNAYVPGALICALFITWYVVGGTATHWAQEIKPLVPAAPAP